MASETLSWSPSVNEYFLPKSCGGIDRVVAARKKSGEPKCCSEFRTSNLLLLTIPYPAMAINASKMAKGGHHASLEKHNAAFESLLHLIPAKFYLVADPDADEDAPDSKYHKNKKRKNSEEETRKRKEKAREGKRAKVSGVCQSCSPGEGHLGGLSMPAMPYICPSSNKVFEAKGVEWSAHNPVLDPHSSTLTISRR